MMNPWIIQNREDLLRRGTDQPLLVHDILIDHKASLPLAADSRDHIDPLPLRLHWQHWLVYCVPKLLLDVLPRLWSKP